MKLRAIEGLGYAIWCPACRERHVAPSLRGWTFDGNLESPTFTPSFMHTWGGINKVCHYYITAGKIAYCADCTHAMAGQTVALPDYPEDE